MHDNHLHQFGSNQTITMPPNTITTPTQTHLQTSPSNHHTPNHTHPYIKSQMQLNGNMIHHKTQYLYTFFDANLLPFKWRNLLVCKPYGDRYGKPLYKITSHMCSYLFLTSYWTATSFIFCDWWPVLSPTTKLVVLVPVCNHSCWQIPFNKDGAGPQTRLRNRARILASMSC